MRHGLCKPVVRPELSQLEQFRQECVRLSGKLLTLLAPYKDGSAAELQCPLQIPNY